MEPRWFALGCLSLVAAQTAISLDEAILSPPTWGVLSVCVWLAYVLARGWPALGSWDKRQFLWGIFSALCFLNYLQYDREFEGWGDVYFFCGRNLQFCTCNFRWNLYGWAKAAVLWSFVLSAALGVQKFAIQMGLNGLLPGEEVVTKESFISICWRLIPYWLNNWEQQWGAECSSMMFELPHFAVELLVILPCVQILCSRMKILAVPQVNVVLHGAMAEPFEFVREHFAPNILKGYWERQPNQRKLMNRLRSNLQVMVFTTTITALAAANAIFVPLYLERQILAHPHTLPVKLAGQNLDWVKNSTLDFDATLEGLALQADHRQVLLRRMLPFHASDHPWVCSYAVDAARATFQKHAGEINKMQDPEHVALIPLVESALAVMRLSCEKFFVLLSVFVSYLLFRDPPRPARVLIRLNSRLSTLFQRVILYSFPAVCWVYGAGFVFSTFVSVVFWGGPLMQFYEGLRGAISTVHIKALSPATPEQIERMGGNCAICWGEMHMPCQDGHGQHDHSHDSGPNLNAQQHDGQGQGLEQGSSSSSQEQGGSSSSGNGVVAVAGAEPSAPSGSSEQRQATVLLSAEATPSWGAGSIELDGPAAGSSSSSSQGAATGDQAGSGAGATAAAPEAEAAAANPLPPSQAAPAVNEGHQPQQPDQQQQQQQQQGTANAAQRAVLEVDAVAAAAGSGDVHGTAGYALPCGHAYHHGCLTQWLHQCHAQGVSPTCPMCQAIIQLEVRWRFPYPWTPPADALAIPAPDHHPGGEWGQRQGQGHHQGRHGGPQAGGGAGAAAAAVGMGMGGVPGAAGGGGVHAAPGEGLPGGAEGVGGNPAAAAGGGAPGVALNVGLGLGPLGLGLLEAEAELQELLLDMPQIMPPENVHLLQEVVALQAEQRELLDERARLRDELQQRQQEIHAMQAQQRALQAEDRQLRQQQQELLGQLQALQEVVLPHAQRTAQAARQATATLGDANRALAMATAALHRAHVHQVAAGGEGSSGGIADEAPIPLPPAVAAALESLERGEPSSSGGSGSGCGSGLQDHSNGSAAAGTDPASSRSGSSRRPGKEPLRSSTAAVASHQAQAQGLGSADAADAPGAGSSTAPAPSPSRRPAAAVADAAVAAAVAAVAAAGVRTEAAAAQLKESAVPGVKRSAEVRGGWASAHLPPAAPVSPASQPGADSGNSGSAPGSAGPAAGAAAEAAVGSSEVLSPAAPAAPEPGTPTALGAIQPNTAPQAQAGCSAEPSSQASHAASGDLPTERDVANTGAGDVAGNSGSGQGSEAGSSGSSGAGSPKKKGRRFLFFRRKQ